MVRFCSSDPALQLASVIWAGYLSDDDSARPIAAVHDSVSSADADAGSGRERLFTGGDLTGSTPTGAARAKPVLPLLLSMRSTYVWVLAPLTAVSASGQPQPRREARPHCPFPCDGANHRAWESLRLPRLPALQE